MEQVSPEVAKKIKNIPCSVNSMENPEEKADLVNSAQKLKVHIESIKSSPQVKKQLFSRLISIVPQLE